MKNIAVDLVTHNPGKGGGGGGIWTVAQNYILHLDEQLQETHSYKVYCFANQNFNLKLNNIKIVRVNFNTENIIRRLFYVHVLLPLYCLYFKINLLQKLATEVPVFCHAKMGVIIHDFMAEYYIENGLNKNKSLLQKIKSKYFSFITKVALYKSDFIITSSQTIKNEAIRRYDVNPDKICVIPFGVDQDNEIKIQPPGNVLRLGCIAGFFPHKGHIRIIEVFEKLIQKFNLNSSLTFRGSNTDLKFYTNVIDRINLSPVKDNIEVISYSREAGLPDIYSEIDIILLLSDYEGFGFPILEAQRFNVPVICSNINIFKEVAGQGAYFVDTNSTDQLSDDIYNLIQNNEELNRLKKLGKVNVNKYRWEDFVKEILKVYKNII